MCCFRIKELELSERRLLVKVNDLSDRSLPHSAPRQRQEEKLHMLREEVRSMVSTSRDQAARHSLITDRQVKDIHSS